MKSTLLSLIVIPIWHHITSSGDKKKGSAKQPKAGVAAVGRRQAEELYYRYHGSKYLRSKNDDAESHVTCFMNMIGPYEAFAGHCADVIEEPSRSDGESQDPKPVRKQIRLDLSRIMRIEDKVVLGSRKGGVIEEQLHRKVLEVTKPTSNTTLVSGLTLVRTTKSAIAAARKLQSYESNFRNDNGEIPSGKNEDDLLDFVRSRAWTQLQFSKVPVKERKLASTGQKPPDKDPDEPLSDSEDDDDDDDDSVEIMASCSAPPANWEPTKSMPGDWVPDGWSCYFVYVCKETRCNDRFLHIFAGDGDALSCASGAISRSQSRNIKAEEDAKDRAIGITGKRGATFLESTSLANAGIRRSADKAMHLTSVFVAMREKTQQLTKEKELLGLEMDGLVNMRDLDGVDGRIRKILQRQNELDDELKRARMDQDSAILAQRNFQEEDTIGKHCDQYLNNHLSALCGTSKKKPKTIVSKRSTPPRNVAVADSGGRTSVPRSPLSVQTVQDALIEES